MDKLSKTSWSRRPVDTKEYPIDPLLTMVDEGKATLKAGCGLHDLIIEIIPNSGDYYYRGRFNLTWEEFNEYYGKPYIDTHNFYL